MNQDYYSTQLPQSSPDSSLSQASISDETNSLDNPSTSSNYTLEKYFEEVTFSLQSLLIQIGRLNFWPAKILFSQIWLLKFWSTKLVLLKIRRLHQLGFALTHH
ncbi:hypothetical protein BpHYR1_051415 [Brachionus plicatilis]|uniref:Uncharacterized protein n=1 Tax=Brachionus plicatilis TaxID=10195 RepID=A0A3M7S212_BRAPC|nr:hypothetical protein BpHYR1_051415 [Brachionus plicatilis]